MKKKKAYPEIDLLNLAAENPALFWSEKAKDLRNTLIQLLKDHYKEVKHDTMMRIGCLLRWILTWPGLLGTPSDFEWVKLPLMGQNDGQCPLLLKPLSELGAFHALSLL